MIRRLPGWHFDRRLALALVVFFVITPRLLIGQRSYLDSPRVGDAIGISAHFIEPHFPKSGEMKLMADAGFGWVRTDLTWENTEGPAGPDFSYYDRLLAEFDRYHIHPIFILCYRNSRWKRGPSFSTDAERGAFGRWAAAAVGHFRGRGIYWEIYNEPNNQMFWEPNPEPDNYTKLAIATARAIRDIAPGEKIIGPATSGIDLEFLERCFSASLLNYLYAVSVHPYRHTNPETVEHDYASLRRLIEKYEPKGKTTPIVSSEWGYSSVWEDYSETGQRRKFDLSDESQGKLLARQVLTNIASGVQVSIWYDWSDDVGVSNDEERHFGIVHPVGAGFALKPAYLAAKTLTSVLNVYRLDRRIDVDSANDHVLLFRNNKSMRYAAWTTSTPHDMHLPIKPGKYQIIDWRGRVISHRIASGSGLVVSLSDAPQYLVPE